MCVSVRFRDSPCVYVYTRVRRMHGAVETQYATWGKIANGVASWMGTGIRWCTREWGCSGYLGRLSIEFGPSERGYMNKAHSFDDEERDRDDTGGYTWNRLRVRYTCATCLLHGSIYVPCTGSSSSVCLAIRLRWGNSAFQSVPPFFSFHWFLSDSGLSGKLGLIGDEGDLFGRMEHIGWQCWREIFA